MARTTGFEMNELLGLIATIAEVTQNSASVVGNSVKTMLSRMSNVKAGVDVDEFGEPLNDVENVLRSVGIELRDNQGNWYDFYDVLNKIAGIWGTLKDTQKSQITTALGGTRQRENVLVALENWEKVKEYAKTGADSEGTAMEKYGIILDSIGAKQEQLTAKVQEFYAHLLNSEIFNWVLEIAQGILDLSNALDGAVGKFFLIMSAISTFNFILKSAKLESFRAIFVEIGGAIKALITSFPLLIKAMKTGVWTTKQQNIENIKEVATTKAVVSGQREKIATTIAEKNAQDALNTSTATGNALAMANPWVALAEVVLTAVLGIATAIDMYKQKQREAVEEFHQLTDEYKNSIQEINNGLKTLTEPSGDYNSLQEEFNKLTKGVDSYGNNISLTNEEYDRYKTICQQIVELNPDLMKGYNSEVEAIGNKNNALQQTIDLLKEEAKQKAKTYADQSDDFLESAQSEYDTDTKDANSTLYQMNRKDTRTIGDLDNIWRLINSSAGESADEYNKVFHEMASKHADEIIKDWEDYKLRILQVKEDIGNSAVIDDNTKNNLISKIDNFVTEFQTDYVNKYAEAQDVIKEANEKLSHSMDEVYQSVLSYSGYNNLDTGNKQFIQNWIKNNYLIDENTSQETINQNKAEIEQIVTALNNNKDLQLDISKFFEIDTTTINYAEYKTKAQEIVDKIIQSLNITNDEQKAKIKLAFDIEIDDEGINKFEGENGVNGLYQKLSTVIGASVDDVKSKIDSMSTSAVQALLGMDDAVLQNVHSWNDLKIVIDSTISDVGSFDTIFSDYVNELQGMSKGYEVLSKAQDEYNQYGNITAQTMKNLIDNNLLDYLTAENGQLQFNTEALQNNANALQNNVIAKLQDSLFTDLQSIALNTYQSTVDSTNTNKANEELKKFQTELGNTSLSALTTESAIASMNSALGTNYNFSDEQKKQADAVVNNYKSMVTKVKSLSTNLISGGYRSKKSKGSGSGKEWWEKDLDMLKKQFEANSITVETYINGLENLLSKLKRGSEGWEKITKELQKIKLDALKKQFDRGEITIDTYISKLEQLRNEYKYNTEGYKNLTDTINKTKADNFADQYERGIISLNQYIDKLTELRNQYVYNSEKWKEYNDLISKTRLDYFTKAYESNEISADEYINELNRLLREFDNDSKEYKDIAKKIATTWVDEFEKAISNIDKQISLLGQVNTIGEQVKYADLLSRKYNTIQNQISEINSLMQYSTVTAEQKVILQKQLDNLLKQEVDIRDEIEDKVKEYYENQKEQAEKQAELKKKQDLYNKEVEIYGEQGKELFEYNTQKEIDALEAKKEALDEVNEKEQLENDLLEAQLKLQNALNNKTTKVLTKQEDGSWQYEFTANMNAIKEAKQSIDSAEKALANYELQQKIDELNKTMEDMNDRYEDAEFWINRQYEQTMNSIEKTYGDIDKLVQEWMQTNGTNTNNLANQYQQVTKSNAELTEAIKQLQISIDSKYETVGYAQIDKPQSFDTGGRTVGSGLALVHDKERVLTPKQNLNFETLISKLNNVGEYLDISRFMFDRIKLSNGLENKQNNSVTTINGVSCIFPNVTSADEVQRAILNLPQVALQK